MLRWRYAGCSIRLQDFAPKAVRMLTSLWLGAAHPVCRVLRIERPACLRVNVAGIAPALDELLPDLMTRSAERLERAGPEPGSVAMMALDVVDDGGRCVPAVDRPAHAAQRLDREMLGAQALPAPVSVPSRPVRLQRRSTITFRGRDVTATLPATFRGRSGTAACLMPAVAAVSAICAEISRCRSPSPMTS